MLAAVPRVASGEVVELIRSASVYPAPKPSATVKRGVVVRGTRARVLETARGKGCRGPWLRIAAQAWVCSDLTRPTDAPPGGEEQPALDDGELVPFTYVITRDAPVYASLDDARAGAKPGVIPGLGGFRVLAVERVGGRAYVKLDEGWVPREEVQYARPSELAAVDLEPGDDERRLGFVRVRAAPVVDRDGRPLDEPELPLHTFLPALGDPVQAGRTKLYPIGSGRFVRARDVGRVRFEAPPEEVAGDELWLDVSLSEQTMVGYRGKVPVFATLVSTGRRSTPKGVFRIERKRATVPMKSKPEHRDKYNLHTPWVMTLRGRIAMHAVYWHDDFGTARSHGCVNLSPRDAKRIWDDTEPALPDGWLRIDSTEQHPGTVVRIRD